MITDDAEDTKEKEKRPGVWNSLFGTAFVLLVIYSIDWGFLKGEVTEYGIAACPNCPTGMMTLNEQKYRPSLSRQEVVSWMPGFDFVDRYTKCAVVNRTNWECNYNDGSGRFGFSNGLYWNDDEKAKEMGWEYVPRWRYLYIYWRNAF